MSIAQTRLLQRVLGYKKIASMRMKNGSVHRASPRMKTHTGLKDKIWYGNGVENRKWIRIVGQIGSIILASHNLRIGIVSEKDESGSSVEPEHIQNKNQTTKKKKPEVVCQRLIKWFTIISSLVKLFINIHHNIESKGTNLIEISSIRCPDKLTLWAHTKYLAWDTLLAPANPVS